MHTTKVGNRSYLPRLVEDLDEGERHRDEAEHQVRDGEVHDEDVPRGPHGRVTHHHEDDEEVAHAADEDHRSVEDDDEGVGHVADAGLHEGRARCFPTVKSFGFFSISMLRVRFTIYST